MKISRFARTPALTAAMLLASVAQAANTPEVEPNDSKANAQLVPMACGDTITGNTTGTSTTVPGAASADTFLIRTTATGGVTEYTLTMTSGAAAPLQTLTIRGLNQVAGVPGTTDTTIQTAATSGTTKVARWYGAGSVSSNQDIYVRVTGTASSTTDYTLTLTCTPVTPTVISAGLAEGNIQVLPDAATATANDTDWWVYDANLNATSDFGHDDADETGAIRSLSAGTYYIAFGNFNTCNNLGSPADDTFRTAALLDFPNVVVNTSTTNLTIANVVVRDGCGRSGTGTGSRPIAFEIPWYQFSVVSPGSGTPLPPGGSGAVAPTAANNCGDQSVLLTVAVCSGANPPSTGIAVTADLSAIGGSSTQAMYDDGTNGDATAGDGTFSYSALVSYTTTTGAKTFPFTVSDAQSRSGNGTITGLTVAACPANQQGACCNGTNCSVLSGPACAGNGGTFSGSGTNCGSPSYTIGLGGGAYQTISGTGTILATASNCDDCAQAIPGGLPFAFNFFNTSYAAGSPVSAISNGNLQFVATGVTTFTNVPIPAAGTPNAAIYPFWDDLNTINAANGQGDIYFKVDGTAPNRTLTVEWFNVSQYIGAGGTITSENFQVVLFETSNNIELRYGTVTPACTTGTGQCLGQDAGGGDYTIGIENQTGTVAYSYPSTSLTSNMSLAVTYVPGVNPCTPACDSPDFNCDGDVGTDADIEAFFACLAGTCPAPPCTNSADFNHDGDIGTDADIESFFRVLAGGPC